MPISLFSVPEHIRNSIIQKFDFNDFLAFHQCSLDSYKCAGNVKTKFLFSSKYTKVHFEHSNGTIGVAVGFINDKYTKEFVALPVRFENASGFVRGFNDEFNISLMNLLLSTNSSTSLICPSRISCCMESLENLYKTGKVKYMLFNELDERDILSLNVPNFEVATSSMTSVGLNTFLKQLINGKRTVEFFSTELKKIRENVILDGVPNTWSEKGNEFLLGSQKTHTLWIDDKYISIEKYTDLYF